MAVLVWIKLNEEEGKMYKNPTNIYKALTYWRGGLCVNPEKGLK